MSREKDVRDRLVSAALRYSENELAIRALTKRMHSAVCLLGSPPCWAVTTDSEYLAVDEEDIPAWYCSACSRSTILVRERHALKLRRVLRREVLLARAYAVAASTEVKGESTTLVPVKVAQLILGTMDGVEGDVTFSTTDRHMFFAVGGRLLFSSLVEQHFPAAERVLVLPAEHVQFDVERKALVTALRRVGVVSRGGTVRLGLGGGALRITADAEKGRVEDELPVADAVGADDAKPRCIHLGLEYLTDYLGTVDAETLTMVLGNEEQPCHVWPKGGQAEHHYVVMPRQP